ncbi:hypothetical protein D3C78_998400 [compost metagenome]
MHNAYRIQLKGESMRKQTRKLTPPGSSDYQCHPCVAALRLPGRMAVERVAGCAWNARPDNCGLGGQMTWNPQPTQGDEVLAGVTLEIHAGTGGGSRCRTPPMSSFGRLPSAGYRIYRLMPGSIGSASVSPDCLRHCSISLLIAAILPATTCTASEPAR